ncbi:OLC1v1013483C1 [Oldenlandia corymbosa var. corymbosa]|uniref:OLC1v1013483C1 n=1 Tax=Oldenlandia corymbosa var. corymbosa TaxID=529605 RepID=A0AAV1E1Z3_OLDCO|nr:OLC1v1013483C1 [Oldenlandia corymbosa var. corymbosa]
MTFLQSLIMFVIQQNVEDKEDLLAHAGAVTIDAGFLLFDDGVSKRNYRRLVLRESFAENKVYDVSTLMQKIKPIRPQVHKTYTEALNSSKLGQAYLFLLLIKANSLISRLKRGSRQLRIMAIVGMPGLGKTTIAEKVYNDPSVSYHFSARAFTTVSQTFDKKGVILHLLNQVDLDKCSQIAPDANAEDVAEQLWHSLKGKPYPIILDNIWDIKAWQELHRSFPDDSKGSRIMVTSHGHDIVPPGMLAEKVFELRLLNVEESLDLLQTHLFGKDGWPPELVDLGKEIVEICNGLPLTILIVARVLRSSKPEEWKKIMDGLRFGKISERSRDTLELSYKHLPEHLKPCLLYFATFEEDQQLSVRRLLSSWMAEGFVRKVETKRLSDVAEGNDKTSSDNMDVGWHLANIDNSPDLCELESITSVAIPCDGVERVLKKFPNLCKLGLNLGGFPDDSSTLARVVVPEALSHLESLDVYHDESNHLTVEFSLPENLKRLSLRDTWRMEDEQFSNLRILKLMWSQLRQWSGSDDQLGCLEKLELYRCFDLKEMPSCLETIPVLQTIKAAYCSGTVARLVKKIGEQQVDYGNLDVKITISDVSWLACHDNFSTSFCAGCKIYTEALNSSKLTSVDRGTAYESIDATRNVLSCLIPILYRKLAQSGRVVDPNRNQLQELYEELRSLREMVIKLQPNKLDQNNIQADIVSVVCDVEVLICSLQQTHDQETGLIRVMTQELSEAIKKILSNLGEKDAQVPVFNSSSTTLFVFIDFLIEKLMELTRNIDEMNTWNWAETIRGQLVSLRSFLEEDIVELPNDQEELQALKRRILEVAYTVEDLIEHYLLVGCL